MKRILSIGFVIGMLIPVAVTGQDNGMARGQWKTQCGTPTGQERFPVGSYVLVFDLFGIHRYIPFLKKAQGRGMRIAATAAAVLLWGAAVFLVTVFAAAAVTAVLH